MLNESNGEMIAFGKSYLRFKQGSRRDIFKNVGFMGVYREVSGINRFVLIGQRQQ
jgi:hypothetical protein